MKLSFACLPALPSMALGVHASVVQVERAAPAEMRRAAKDLGLET